MNIIYVVTSGIYSDYSIDGVYTTYEAAQKAIEAVDFECRIEEYQLDAPIFESNAIWAVKYHPKQDIWKTESCNVWPKSFLPTEVRLNNDDELWDAEQRRVVKSPSYTTVVRAPSKDAALKIANEKIMMAIARGK